ncbi:MAG: toxin-antitoxin system YwqK family antitoxin [Bacteroidetes bacterium]|nr:MAG: toxin-antitoxin system YwqK family antitoxin [Bacteroidota bacterium]
MRTTNWYVLAFVGTCLLLSGCSQPRTEKVERTDEYGYLESYERRLEDFAKEGLYRKMKPDGTVVEEAYYRHDTLHGIRILYHDNGDTSVVEHYHAGRFDGPYRRYHENGKLQQVGQYEDNALAGVWTTYYANGQVREVVNFANNQENGPFVEYYPNGQLKAEGQYLDGDNEDGELKLYNEAGKLVRIMDCDKGRCKTRWKAEGAEDK